jgi:hypothetical protein
MTCFECIHYEDCKQFDSYIAHYELEKMSKEKAMELASEEAAKCCFSFRKEEEE